jgi:hypothetical protein
MLTIDRGPLFGQLVKLPTPNATGGYTGTPRTTTTPLFGMPGQRIGSAPAPLASPSIGLVMSPHVSMMAAIAGVRAARAAAKTKGTL